ncbi:translesion error-prone DNA polymerase V autoproteolytic subunit [bacterium]|nr:translesion error-prone DNA polymerase V autoproteolytic subunit [bacterium]
MDRKNSGEQNELIASVLGGVEGNAMSAPLYQSRPSAGFPTPGDDLVEKALDINDLVVKNPTATFFVRVEGDSMEGAGIFSGDVLVVDRSIEPQNGTIVVAAIYGEMVVKRLAIEGEQRFLISENENYEPIAIGDGEDCFVWGAVVGSVRQF